MNQQHIGAGIVFLTSNYKTLLLQKENKKWSFPGGHAERHETPLQTARRECIEEIGYMPKGKYLGSIKFRKKNKFVHSFFILVDAPFVPVLSREHIEYKWQDIRKISTKQLTSVFSSNWSIYPVFAILNLM
jgi:8-oxo-dGTP pyrophosphatase MutT (NUDIX family)